MMVFKDCDWGRRYGADIFEVCSYLHEAVTGSGESPYLEHLKTARDWLQVRYDTWTKPVKYTAYDSCVYALVGTTLQEINEFIEYYDIKESELHNE